MEIRRFGNTEFTEVGKLANAVNSFNHDLGMALVESQPDINMVYSSISLSTALAMARIGARNQSAAEIENTCKFTPNELDMTSLLSAYKTLLGALEKANKPEMELVLSNRLYVQQDYQIKSEFSTTLQTFFQIGEIPQLDFKYAARSAAEINAWVTKATKNKIKDLISPDMLDEYTRLVLLNAVYFKGLWKNPFNKGSTSKGIFSRVERGVNGSAQVQHVPVDMMYIKRKFPYVELNEIQVVELPYQGEELSMLIYLPRNLNGIEHFRTQLIDHKGLFTQMSSHYEIELKLPRFRVEVAHTLVEPLKQLGLTSIFKQGVADFSGITETEPLYVSAIVQKAFIEVNEEGTEAAAATGIFATSFGAPRIIRMTVDHPFMFEIIHKPSKLALFSGWVLNPAAAVV